MSPKKIPLKVWAEQNYSPAPSRPTLRKWREEGQIYPPPEPVPPFYVEATAVRLFDGQPVPATLVDRMRA